METSPLWNPRGSEWHRWDPHIHAPGTAQEDRFAGDWEGYLSRIESATPTICALGITDYLSIETYKQVRQFKAQGRLPNVGLVFPNVEMRLDTKTARGKGINIHLLFSPNTNDHESEIERVLGHLMFEFQGTKYQCTRSGLTALGRKVDHQQTDEGGAFREGVRQFKVSLDDLRGLFREDAWVRENCLVAVANSQGDGTAGLQDDGGFTAFRQEIERFTHIILSGKQGDRDFWLGRKAGHGRESIERIYGAIKPCIHGSDAHGLDRVGVPDLDRLCWIKGDLSFESLRQIVIEPEERVFIGPQVPSEGADSVTLTSVTPIGMPWLLNPAIPINRGLVSIIGARGSGKTALADLIAAGAQAIESNAGESSFLLRAISPTDLIGDAQVEETWADGEKTTAPFRPLDEWDESQPAVRYLSQQFVDRLCSSAGLAVELKTEIERVIFEQIEITDRYETNQFTDLADLLLDPVRRRRKQQGEEISDLSRRYADEMRLRDQLPVLRAEFKKLGEQIGKARNDLAKLIPKEKVQHAKGLIELEQACSHIEAQIEGLRRRQKALGDLRAECAFMAGEESERRLVKLREEFAECNFGDAQWETFRLKFSGEIEPVIRQEEQAVSRQSTILMDGDPQKPFNKQTDPRTTWPLSVLKKDRDEAKKTVGIDESQQKKYEALNNWIRNSETALKKQDANIKKAEGAEAKMKELRNARRQAYRSIFDGFAEEERILQELYSPIHKQLEGEVGALSKLRFAVRRSVAFNEWIAAGEGMIDLRKDSAFRGHGGLATIAKESLLAHWQNGTPEEVAEAMQDFLAKHSDDMVAAMPSSVPPAEKAAWLCRVGEWLYNTDHVSIRYALEYDGVPIERLSPGTRGIVLLLVYLVIDRSDRRPLLIDQPEENLDPKSVFDDLVPHFRLARHRRQVIIVTHNANLVVNTDADQVIVATSTMGRPGCLPNIEYTSGSLENPAIRSAVCNILEGGQRAFLERERRYRLQWQHIFSEREAV